MKAPQAFIRFKQVGKMGSCLVQLPIFYGQPAGGMLLPQEHSPWIQVLAHARPLGCLMRGAQSEVALSAWAMLAARLGAVLLGPWIR